MIGGRRSRQSSPSARTTPRSRRRWRSIGRCDVSHGAVGERVVERRAALARCAPSGRCRRQQRAVRVPGCGGATASGVTVSSTTRCVGQVGPRVAASSTAPPPSATTARLRQRVCRRRRARARGSAPRRASAKIVGDRCRARATISRVGVDERQRRGSRATRLPMLRLARAHRADQHDAAVASGASCLRYGPARRRPVVRRFCGMASR